MQITITGHGLEITAPLRDYVHAKAGKLEEFFSNIQKVEVVLDARSNADPDKRQVAEFRAWLSGLKMIQSKEAGRDMYAAIDLAVEEAKRQIERHKEKHVHEQRRKAEKEKQIYRETPYFSEKSGPVLVNTSRFAAKPMSPEEARAELMSMGQDFLAFRNTENKEVNVIRRNQERFDILRPEKEFTPEQALSELQQNGKDLLIFNNPLTSCPAVIFRRKSGNFGLIEPEF
jgi:putative sigma-54 modulation protein